MENFYFNTIYSLLSFLFAQVMQAANAVQAWLGSLGWLLIEWRTVFLLAHLAGLVVGLGAALLMEVRLLPHLRHRPLERRDLDWMETGGTCVKVGLALLWLSGAGLVALAWLKNPDILFNPKLHAKLVIVGLLTANGWVLHQRVLPYMRRQVGRTIFAGASRAQLAGLMGTAALSLVSWQAAAYLGMARELNFAGAAADILWLYVLLVLSAWGMAGMTNWLVGVQAKAPALVAQARQRSA
jgi:hypothetical protein